MLTKGGYLHKKSFKVRLSQAFHSFSQPLRFARWTTARCAGVACVLPCALPVCMLQCACGQSVVMWCDDLQGHADVVNCFVVAKIQVREGDKEEKEYLFTGSSDKTIKQVNIRKGHFYSNFLQQRFSRGR